MKIGDKRQANVVKFTGDEKKYTLDYFNKLTEDEEERKLIELERKKREVNERAKLRF